MYNLLLLIVLFGRLHYIMGHSFKDSETSGDIVRDLLYASDNDVHLQKYNRTERFTIKVMDYLKELLDAKDRDDLFGMILSGLDIYENVLGPSEKMSLKCFIDVVRQTFKSMEKTYWQLFPNKRPANLPSFFQPNKHVADTLDTLVQTGSNVIKDVKKPIVDTLLNLFG